MDALGQIARTLLYEGYVLWPYRRSAVKNQMRWTIGGAYPPAFAEASGGTDRSTIRAEFLVEAPATDDSNALQQPVADISIRFLQVVKRQVMRSTPAAQADRVGQELGESVFAIGEVPVSELRASGQRHLSWDEATERAINFAQVPLVHGEQRLWKYHIPRDVIREALNDNGASVGAIVRSWETLDATAATVVTELPSPANGIMLFRVSVELANTNETGELQRETAVRHTFVSAHVTLQVSGAQCVSQFDPPSECVQHAAANQNDGLWPILVGADGSRDTMLASPIILYDYPRLAPESPGDLFDGGEIDQLLILNVLSLTEEEQQEMRDSDPRAREVLDRCLGLSDDALARLHGTMRSLSPATGDQA